MILEYIRKLPHGRATFKQLLRELPRHGLARPEIDAEIQRLLTRGEIVEPRSGQFVAVGSNREYAAGRLNVHRDGYAFVTPEVPIAGLKGDIYIAKEAAARAMHGDRVVVRIGRIEADGRAHGEILRVLRRAHPSVVGEFRIRRNGIFVVPHDDRIRQWIEIPQEMALPKGESAHRVGARAVEVHSVEDLDGMIVTAEIVDFGDADERPVGRIIEILGRPDDFGIDVEILIRAHHIPHHFPEPVLEQARAIPRAISDEEIARRRDFRALDIVTIDGETARDFDDAVWVERLPNGHFALQVHIADVSHYVTARLAHRSRSRAARHQRLLSRTAPCPCCLWSFRPINARCVPHEDRLVLSALLEIDTTGRRGCAGVLPGPDSQRRAHDLYRGARGSGRRSPPCGSATRP